MVSPLVVMSNFQRTCGNVFLCLEGQVLGRAFGPTKFSRRSMESGDLSSFYDRFKITAPHSALGLISMGNCLWIAHMAL